MSRNVGWVVMGPDPWLATCQRCGVHIEKPALPMPLDKFARYLRRGVVAHKGCQP